MDVKFKIGNDVKSNIPSIDKGSLIIDKINKKLYIDTDENTRIQVGGNIVLNETSDGSVIDEISVDNVIGIPLTIDEKEYYLLAIAKN